MYINSKPTRWLDSLRYPEVESSKDIFPLTAERCYFFYSARYALAAGLNCLKPASYQNILLPSYNCWVEIDPLLSKGTEILYYPVDMDMSVNIDKIRAVINSNTRAILITHYLGFPQSINELQQICEDYGILLIEDCAHAFLSEYQGAPVGSFGDIAIFSFRKTFPIPDGGALVINNPELEYVARPRSPSTFSCFFLLAEYLRYQTRPASRSLKQYGFYFLALLLYEFFFAARGVLRLYHKLVHDKGLYLTYPSGNLYRKEIENWGMSSISKRIMLSTDFDSIRRTRRSNYVFLLNRLQRYKKLFLPLNQLPEGVCPLHFPVVFYHREQAYSTLKRKGIRCHNWWGDFHPHVPWHRFSDAQYLKKNVLGLPIHQDLTFDHLLHLLAEFDRIYANLN